MNTVKDKPKLIVMLTHHDRTVEDAAEIFEECTGSAADFWGFKEDPLPHDRMKALYARMKACGKTTFLEVVAYSEEEGLAGAKLAVSCGCDVLMGTCFFDSINDYCKAHGLKYMPFVGEITGRPSILSGSIDGMIHDAETYLEKGVYGIDLLAYRYTGDAGRLIREFTSRVHAPICIAGSVNSLDRLDEVKAAGPWAFTIGGAFFEDRFGASFSEQVDRVCAYMDKTSIE